MRISRSENKSSKSGTSSSISGNDKKVYGADIRPTHDTESLEQIDNNDYNVFIMEKGHPEFMVRVTEENTKIWNLNEENNSKS
ncbi:hypothetical protein Tco_1294075 [Tanacetum coccineum]